MGQSASMADYPLFNPPKPEPAKSSEKPMKLPAKQRPRTKSRLKQRRKQARHFVKVTMRNGLTKVLKSATKTLRLGWYVRNSRRSKHRWERPFYFDVREAAANAAGFKERVVGPSFIRGGQAFCLELYPGGFREDSRQHVGAYLRYQGAQKCVELRFRVSVVNRLGGPEIAWRSAFMLLGARAAPGERIFTNWGTASLCPRSWLGDLKHRGLCVDGAVRFRVDIMYVGERESVDNQIVRMASADAEGLGEAGGAGDAACLGSGVHRRDYDAALELKSPRNPLALREETKEPPEDVDESRVTYKFDDQGDEPLLVDFEFS